MNAISKQKRAEVLDTIVSLAVTCPVDKCNPHDCPLYLVRQMELPERLRWFKALTDEDLMYLNAYHFVCMKTKMESLVALESA